MVSLPLRSLLAAGIALATALPTPAQTGTQPQFVVPFVGQMVLAGSPTPPECVRDIYLHLAGGANAKVVVLTTDKAPAMVPALRERGATDVHALTVPRRGLGKSEDAVLLLLEADAVWLANDLPLERDPVGRALIRNVLARGGVVGAGGSVAEALARTEPNRKNQLALLHGMELACGRDNPEPTVGTTQFAIDSESALVLHHRRSACAYGTGKVTVQIAAHDGWPAVREPVEVIDVYETGDDISYTIDVMAWTRAGHDRSGPLFPAKRPPAPRIAKGTLILQGGAGVTNQTFNAFIEAAGGKDAQFVCIPSAKVLDEGEPMTSYSENQLRERGCLNVRMLHEPDPRKAHVDAELHGWLKNANGVWIDGGRTYQFMDAYQGTRIQELLAEVLARGGVVGGSSAGCQVAGDFLVRGNPNSNKTIEMPGYVRALGLLKGVVMDAHFLQRERHEPMLELMGRYPQLLGIGVDEKTAILVRGGEATVLGKNQVSFYDLSGDEPRVTKLGSGEKFELVRRVKVGGPR